MSFFSINRKGRFRITIKSIVILSISAIGVTYGIHLFTEDDAVVPRPILPALLVTHSTETPLALPVPLTLPKAAANVSPGPQSYAPSAVMAALSLPSVMQEDALAKALREWAMREPERALVFAKSLQIAERAAAIQTVLETLGHQPALALKAGRQLLIDEPDQAEVYGSLLIGALSSAKEFTTALELANSTGADNGRTAWTAEIIGQWTRAQPEMAAQLATLVSRPGTPDAVVQAFTDAFASFAPTAAADFALTLPANEARQGIVVQAVSEWVHQDPKAASEWIDDKLRAGPEFDQALATLLTQSSQDFYSHQTALDRVISISDPTLRANTRTALMRIWAETDRPAALNYLQLAKEVSPEERGHLFAELTQPAAPMEQGEPRRLFR